MAKFEQKIRREMDSLSLSTFFKRLADEFGGEGNGSDGDLAGICNDLQKFELKIKPYGNYYKLRLKVEHAQSAATGIVKDSDSAVVEKPEKYKPLKKRMKKDFKAISTTLDTNRLPESEIVDRFIADSRRMIEFEGYGDIHYDAYRQAYEQFRKAYIANDFDAVKHHFEVLGSLKRECHKAFK